MMKSFLRSEHQPVSSPVLTNSELISIGRPLTPIAQDASWADHPQQDTPSQESPSTPPPQVNTPVLDDDDYVVQPTPSPKASPTFRRLRKGPRPQVTLPSVPEGEVQNNSVARQVFPDVTPTANVSESEAKAVEDFPAVSADDQQEPRQEEERAATPPTNQEVVLEENESVPDPLAIQVEVENTEAATNNTTEANDVVMAEANVAPKVDMVPEANFAPEAIVQHEAHVNANAPVPPPRPNTIELAFDRGQPVMVHWPILVPPPAPGP